MHKHSQTRIIVTTPRSPLSGGLLATASGIGVSGLRVLASLFRDAIVELRDEMVWVDSENPWDWNRCFAADELDDRASVAGSASGPPASLQTARMPSNTIS